MSRTRRIYNNPKASRKHGFKLCWIWWHPYKQGCMGRCSFCRDPKKEQRIIRKQRKSEFRRFLPEETSIFPTPVATS